MQASFRLAHFFLFETTAWEIKAQENYYVCKSMPDLFWNGDIRNLTRKIKESTNYVVN